MKISGAVIQDKRIELNDESNFIAQYKGKDIVITTMHDLGKAKHDFLKRYNIEVRDINSGLLDVNDWEDCHTMKDAIRYALKGACLIG